MKQLVLIGGGHSHAIALNLWARDIAAQGLHDKRSHAQSLKESHKENLKDRNALTDTQITLISPQQLAPYSGMLPGLIAGHYSLEQTHIDLPALCHKANARFIQSSVTSIDLKHKQLTTADGSTLAFDRASINCGITPNTDVPGAAQFCVGVKPIAHFYPRWLALLDTLTQRAPTQAPYRIAVVGGGAAGVEIVLAMQCALHKQFSSHTFEFTLIHSSSEIPEGYPESLQRKIRKHVTHKQIRLLDQTRVSHVTQHQLTLVDSRQAVTQPVFDTVFWCTQADAAEWPRDSGLATDEKGFIRVNENLQSLSHPHLFACGDIASQDGANTPKAGVFAVRQGPLLYRNLIASLQDKPLTPFKPQAAYLSLLAAGEQYAWGCRIGQEWLPSFAGRWVWQWKNAIDQRFMKQF